MTRPKGYRSQNACVNCKHAWQRSHEFLYCRQDGTRAPNYNGPYNEEVEDNIRTWDETHQVREHEICDKWESKK